MLDEEERKAIKVLEKYKNECIEDYKVELDDKDNIDEQKASYLHQQIEAIYRILNLIEKLQKEKEEYRINWCNKGEEVERLKKIIYENIIIEPDENGCYEELNIHISDYIPKKVIKDKLQENKAKTYCKNCDNTCDSYQLCKFLEELLGDE